MHAWELVANELRVDGKALIGGVGSALALEAATPHGVFLSASFAERSMRHVVALGWPGSARRFASCFRYDPFWMTPQVGSAPGHVKADTQYILFELRTGQYLFVVPLVNEPYHASIGGAADGMTLVFDSGAPTACANRALAVYVAVLGEPYALLRQAAVQVSARLGHGRLRRDKPVPAFVDRLGWCTWDAFYREVSTDKVVDGLRSFDAGGVRPGFLILDDGWQAVSEPTNQGRVTSLTANDKFRGGLAPLVRAAKEQFGLETFMVWHAVYGYWGGADGDALPGYDIAPVLRWYSPEVLSHVPEVNCDTCGPLTHRPGMGRLHAFYDDYHRWLAAEGVDGVKVDNQSSVEGLAHDVGGRVVAWRTMREALERSAREHFDGCLINCMSNASECYYFAADSTVTRTSTDFWPRQPETHGLHLYVNAMVGLWFGEFNHPDWDMFQSGHVAGAFHAAARAVSGGPIYVSDVPETQDFDLLRQLVLSDGSVPRCLDVARPTLDTLFDNPTGMRACSSSSIAILAVRWWGRSTCATAKQGMTSSRAASAQATSQSSKAPSAMPCIR